MNYYEFITNQLIQVASDYEVDDDSLISQWNLEDAISLMCSLYRTPFQRNSNKTPDVHHGLAAIEFINKWCIVAQDMISFTEKMAERHGRCILGLGLLKTYFVEQKSVEEERLQTQKGLQAVLDGKGVSLEELFASLKTN